MLRRFTTHTHTHPTGRHWSRCDVCGLPRMLARILPGADARCDPGRP